MVFFMALVVELLGAGTGCGGSTGCWSYWSLDPCKKTAFNKAEHEALSAGAWKPTAHTEST